MTKSKSAGFTLIELVIVIVILGVLAAVAAPRFIDLSQDAERSSLQAQASAIESASAINFASAAADGSRDDSGDAVAVENCGNATDVLSSALDTDQFAIVDDSISGSSFGEDIECELALAGDSSVNVPFTLIVVPQGQ